MDLAMNEMAAIEKIVVETLEVHISELNELQLARVGGGIAEVVF